MSRLNILKRAARALRVSAMILLIEAGADTANAVNMKQIATFANIGGSKILCGDANLNTRCQIYANSPPLEPPGGDSLVVYAYESNDTFSRQAFPFGGSVQELGNGNGDSLWELVADFQGYYLRILKSPDRYSYPTDSVWQKRILDGQDVYPKFIDLDQDGYKELACSRTPNGWIWLYEYTGVDDQYESSAVLVPPIDALANFDVGDFDLDGRMDLVSGSAGGSPPTGGWAFVFEGTGVNNQYVLSAICSTATIENFTVFSAHDKDGWPEFGVVGRAIDTEGTGFVQIFKATAPSQYHLVWSQRIPYNPLLSYYSASAADVDGDGADEIALTNGTGTLLLFHNTGPNSYEQVWQVPSGPHIKLCDVNGDHRAEVITDRGIYEDTTGLTQLSEAKPIPEPPCAQVRPAVVRLGTAAVFSGLPVQAELNLYSVGGQLVRKQATGMSTTWVWDLTDQHVRRVPAGTYFAVIRSGATITKSKLCVIN